jgi:cytochrome d ubiquinol oxidase subunit II
MTATVAAVLLASIVLYGVFGGADFGAGLWDLTAGGATRGARARSLIDHAIGPVWEANHTWLIFCLVLLWTGFPAAFAAIMTTLYVPLGIAAFGVVLRGSGFAFRKVSLRTAGQRLNGVVFASSSVLTPFCFGAVAGAVASGRVPSAGHGDPLTSWLNPTSVLGGVLAVLTCGYLAAVFLTAEAHREARADPERSGPERLDPERSGRERPEREWREPGKPDLERWARRRAVVAAVACGGTALVGLFVLRGDAHRLYGRLLAVGWPLVALSAAAGLAALLVTVLGGRRSPAAQVTKHGGQDRLASRVSVPRRGHGLARPLAALAVAAVLAGWGVAQYPYLLGTHLTLAAAASPAGTMTALVVVTVAAVAVVVPSLLWLLLLTNRGRLADTDGD